MAKLLKKRPGASPHIPFVSCMFITDPSLAPKHRRGAYYEETSNEERRANGHISSTHTLYVAQPTPFTNRYSGPSPPHSPNAAGSTPNGASENTLATKKSRTLKFPGFLGPLRRLTRRGHWATKPSKSDKPERRPPRVILPSTSTIHVFRIVHRCLGNTQKAEPT